MMRFHLQLKLEIILATHYLTKGTMIILLKYVENTKQRKKITKNGAQI